LAGCLRLSEVGRVYLLSFALRRSSLAVNVQSSVTGNGQHCLQLFHGQASPARAAQKV